MALNKFTQIGNSGFGTDTSINTTGIITAASFSGDGSALTGVVGSGSGVVVQEEGTNVGTAQTINFVGTGVTATISGSVARIEITSGSGGGGGGGLSDVVSDTTPQLGGNLDLNSNNITGTGDINITGDATFSGDLDVDGHVNLDNVSIAGVSTFSGTTEVKNTSFRVTNSSASGQYLQITQNSNSSLNLDKVGDGAFYIRGNNIYLQNDGSSETYAGFEANGRSYLNYDASTKFETTSTGAIVTGTLVATATTATNVTVADESTDTSCFLLYSTEATGNVSPKTGSNLTFNSSSGTLSAGSFVGDGSGLTGITASGSGVVIRDDGSLVGTAGTIDFGANVSVSPISAGVVTVTADAGTIIGINTSATTELNRLTVAGVSTFTGAIDANGDLDVDGHTNLDNVSIAGVVTATSFVKTSGTSSQFLKADGSVDSSAYLTSYTETDPVVAAINGIVKSDGSTISAATAGTDYLAPTGDGSGLTGIGTAFTNVQATWSVGGDTSGYTFTGPGQDGAEQNPDIYLVRGQRYRFINTTGSGHPFEIRVSDGGSAYTDGITGSTSGTQDFNVQHDAPVRLYYQCTIHSGMIGNIYIVGGSDWRMTDVLTNQTPEIFTSRKVSILNGTNSGDAVNGGDNLVIKDNDGCGISLLSGDGNSSNIFLGSQTDEDAVRLEGFYNSGFPYFKLYTNNTARLQVDSGGRVAIGNTDPSLYNAALNGLVVKRGGTNEGITIDCSNQGGLFFVNGTNSFAGQLIYYHTPGDESMRFLVQGEKLRIEESGIIKTPNLQGNNHREIHRHITGFNSGSSVVNYLLICETSRTNVRLAGRLFTARASGTSATSAQLFDVTFQTNHDATHRSGAIMGLHSGSNGYGHAEAEFVSLTYNSTNYYAIRFNSGWVTDFDTCSFDGIRDHTGTELFTHIDSINETITNVSVLVNSSNKGDVTIQQADLRISDGDIIMPSGHGISFSATGDGSGTMSSELLDDYEEGSWTPSVTFGGTAATVSSGGKYTKIGNVIHITYQVTIDNLNSGTGNIAVGGLPYTPSQSPTYAHGIVQGNSSKNLPSTAGSTMAFIENNGSTFRILYDTPTSHGDVNETMFGSGVTFYGNATYYTA